MRKTRGSFDIVSPISEYRGPAKGEIRRKAEKCTGDTEAENKIARLRALRLSRDENPTATVKD